MKEATLGERVKVRNEKVRDLLAQTQSCPEQPGRLEIHAWNNGWNQFSKGRGS